MGASSGIGSHILKRCSGGCTTAPTSSASLSAVRRNCVGKSRRSLRFFACLESCKSPSSVRSSYVDTTSYTDLTIWLTDFTLFCVSMQIVESVRREANVFTSSPWLFAYRVYRIFGLTAYNTEPQRLVGHLRGPRRTVLRVLRRVQGLRGECRHTYIREKRRILICFNSGNARLMTRSSSFTTCTTRRKKQRLLRRHSNNEGIIIVSLGVQRALKSGCRGIRSSTTCRYGCQSRIGHDGLDSLDIRQ